VGFVPGPSRPSEAAGPVQAWLWALRRRRVKALGYLRRVWLQSRWEIVAISGALVLLLGWSGFNDYFRLRDEPRPAYDSLYHSLCLFVFEGGDVTGDVPMRLQLARFLAPLVVFAAAVGAAMAVLHGELQRFMAHWVVRGHVIVVGLGGRGLELGRQLVDSGHQCAIVDVIDTAPESTRARLLGIPVVVSSGEADVELVEADLLTDVLHRAGVHRSSAVVVMTGSPALDARFAHVLHNLQDRTKATFQAFVEMDDVDGLRNVLGYQVAVGDGALEWFSLTDRAARSLLDRLEGLLAPGDGVDRHLVVVGATPLGRSLIVQMARNWSRETSRSNGARAAGRLVLSLVEPTTGTDEDLQRAEEEELRQLRRRDPRVPSSSSADELRVKMCDLVRTPFDEVLSQPAPSVVIVTADDDHELLRRATEVTASLPRSMPVWLCSERSGGIVDVVTGPHGDVGGRRKVDVFHVLDTVLREDEIRRGIDEEFARAVHRAYCQRRSGEVLSREDQETVRPWDRLGTEIRRLNYATVAAWRRVLEAHGYHLTPYSTLGAEHVLLPVVVIEELAVATHESWSEERQRQGFRHGAHKNADRTKGRLTHPEIGVPFADLPPSSQEWSRDQARSVPDHLAAAGLQLYPLPVARVGPSDHNGAVELSVEQVEELAKALHQLYRDNIRADDHEPLGSLAWAELTDSQRENNRETARALPSAFGRLGYALQPSTGAPHAATELTRDEIERLAVVEHDRWARHKASEGYVYGRVRCDDGHPPTHPDLVGWNKLDEHARAKDRIRISEAPRLLAEIGYEIVRVRASAET
jgi:hypothetical protein